MPVCALHEIFVSIVAICWQCSLVSVINLEFLEVAKKYDKTVYKSSVRVVNELEDGWELYFTTFLHPINLLAGLLVGGGWSCCCYCCFIKDWLDRFKLFMILGLSEDLGNMKDG